MVANVSPKPKLGALPSADASWRELRAVAEMFYDLQRFRIAQRNRSERAPVTSHDLYHLLADDIEGLEKKLETNLLYRYREIVTPAIERWREREAVGVGEHLMARLLGHLGPVRIATPKHWEENGSGATCGSEPMPGTPQNDVNGSGARAGAEPILHAPRSHDKRVLIEDEPFERTLGQLWQYCGVGDPADKRQRGVLARHNPKLKMIVYLMASGCVKLTGNPDKNGRTKRRSPFRDVYDRRRAETMERVHAAPCVPCGRKNHPAETGTPWRDGHKQADALRIVGKELLRGLWIAAGE